MEKWLDDMLYRVEKPSRYIGDEVNMCKKEITEDLVRVGFGFPDVYEVGMSHLGMHILYGVLNEMDNVYCERIFSPWSDFEQILREEKRSLFTVETKSPVADMDILAFTLQYELSYTNILNIMDMGGIPLRAKDRSDDTPLIFAGGPCAYNPEPLAEIMDFFVMGEGEEVLPEIIEVYRKVKSKEMTKAEYLKAIAKIEGIYVPSFYSVSYNEDGTIAEFGPISEEYPKKIKKRIIEDMNTAYYPEKFLVPYTDIVHDRAMIEIFRGCTRGCRFCQAGMIYRPIREKSAEVIIETAQKIIRSTGFEEMALTSLSTLDHTEIEKAIMSLVKEYENEKIGVSLPSLRLDAFAVEVLQEIQKIRKTGLTFAPEAGTQRMRDVINKGVTEDDLVTTMDKIFRLGWNKVKLYFMMGLPTETFEDLEAIADLGNKVTYTHKTVPRELRRDGLTVSISTSCFVPKPFTPFQWMAQDTLETFQEKQRFLRKTITNKKIRFTYHDAHTSVLEGAFARGDRRLNEVLIKAWELGCRFDGWQEYFDYDKWMEAFKLTGVDMDFYSHRERSYDEILPWDHIDVGVRKDYLIKENDKAVKEEITQDCRDACTGCGMNVDFLGGAC